MAITLFAFFKYALLDIEVSLKYEEWDKDLFTNKKQKILNYIQYCKYFILSASLAVGAIVVYKLVEK